MKKFLIGIVVIILVALAFAYWSPSAVAPVADEQPIDTSIDTTESINQDLQTVDISGELDADLGELDADIESL